MEHVWFKNAVFYSVDVETYYDSNGDGIGDFAGLTEKIEYIAGLGVSCVWLLPFYPSSNRDNGYDIIDYYNVDERLGTLGDFAQFLNKAEQTGLRVIIDLVVNHTSNQHPWFQKAVSDRNSPYREYYVWSDEPLDYPKEYLMFNGEEDSIWNYHEKAGQYYLHRFYKEQPDLNIGNPLVKDEIFRIIDFWLRLGVNGFRIDAAELLVEPYGIKGTEDKDLISFVDEIREYVQWRQKDALLLAEVNTDPKGMENYLHQGERMHMLFNFYLNQHLFISLAEENKAFIEKAMKSLPDLDKTSQWLNFLRHHDELNLRLLPKSKQQKVFEIFAPDENMQLYGFGIRRRLAPMMAGNMARLKMAYSLLFSLPGTQLLRYGDEIGMGDNLNLEGRDSVRTPMQWSPAKNGGFSDADPNNLIHPMIQGGEFGYENVNVMHAQHKPSTLLNWLKRLVSTRRQSPEIGLGQLFIVKHNYKQVLCHGYEYNGRKLLFIHNFSGKEIKIPREKLGIDTSSPLFDSFSDEVKDKSHNTFTLQPYCYRWFCTQ
jgi:maltose alpha-D-glucosyltransferase/alpha-amylase